MIDERIVRLSPVDGVERRLKMQLRGAYLVLIREFKSSAGGWHAEENQEMTIPVSGATDLADVAAKLVVMWEARRSEEIAERTRAAEGGPLLAQPRSGETDRMKPGLR